MQFLETPSFSESAFHYFFQWLFDGTIFLKNIIEQDPFLEKVVIQWKPMFWKNFILGNGSNFLTHFHGKRLFGVTPFSWKEFIIQDSFFGVSAYLVKPHFLESAHLLEDNFFEIACWARPHGYGKWLLREKHFRGNNYPARPNCLFGGKLILTATLGVIWWNNTLRKMDMEQDPFFAMWLFGETQFFLNDVI